MLRHSIAAVCVATSLAQCQDLDSLVFDSQAWLTIGPQDWIQGDGCCQGSGCNDCNDDDNCASFSATGDPAVCEGAAMCNNNGLGYTSFGTSFGHASGLRGTACIDLFGTDQFGCEGIGGYNARVIARAAFTVSHDHASSQLNQGDTIRVRRRIHVGVTSLIEGSGDEPTQGWQGLVIWQAFIYNNATGDLLFEANSLLGDGPGEFVAEFDVPNGFAVVLRLELNLDARALAWGGSTVTVDARMDHTVALGEVISAEDLDGNPITDLTVTDPGGNDWSGSFYCPADLAQPYAVLNFSDVLEYLTLFAKMNAAADLAEPEGVFDFSDVFEYIVAFGEGCPYE